jgi:hypothetical protein
MSNNKTINQFPTDVVLTGTEYILGMSEGVTIKLVLDNIKSFVLSGQSSGSTAVYLTGATYDNSTGTLNLINSSGETIPVTGFYTGGTSDLPVVYVTGGTYSDGVATFTNTTGGTFDVTGFYTGDTSQSVSDLGFVVTPKVSAVINQNVILPENSNVTYPSPLTIGDGYTITVPSTTTLTII